jgi:RNA polymerase sigma factor (sigma-70 family)
MTVRPFEEIVEAYGPTVMRVCRSLLGPADADDAWAETFLAALRAYPRLRPGSNVRAWLVTIAHRKAIDQIRAAARRPQPAPEIGEASSTRWDPARRDGDLFAAWHALPPKQRSAVAYHHVAGLSYAEVGILLKTGEVAARRSAADGIANLRRSYARGRRARKT